MDVNEESVAPWNLDGRVEDDAQSGDGISEVTTATGCAVSRRSARNFWDKLCTCLLLLAAATVDEAEDQRVGETVVAEIVGGRNIVTKKGKSFDLYPVREAKGLDRFAVTFHAFHAARAQLVSGQRLSAIVDMLRTNGKGKCPTLCFVPFYRTLLEIFCHQFCHLSLLARLGPTEFRP